jgi:hypothetical protein
MVSFRWPSSSSAARAGSTARPPCTSYRNGRGSVFGVAAAGAFSFIHTFRYITADARFPIVTRAVSATRVVELTATYQGVTRRFSITVHPSQ